MIPAAPRRPPAETTIRRPLRAAAGLLLWTGLVWLTHVWGERLVRRDPASRIFAAPLAGRLDPRLSPLLLLALAVAVAAVAGAPRLAGTLSWHALLWACFAGAAVWAMVLASGDGLHAVAAPLTTRWDYLVDLPRVGSVPAFLSGFTSNAAAFSTHVRAHPPGMLLLLWSLHRIGLSGPGPEAALVIAGGAAMVPAALVVLREVAGGAPARAAAPFLAFLPAALWVATSADALFAGVAAWGAALMVLSTGRRDRTGDVQALGGGLLLGVAAFLSYGLVLVWLIPTAVAAWRRRLRPILIAAGAAGAVGLAFAGAGFAWTAGWASAHAQYLRGAARARPQHYFWLGNLGAFALALGPAVAAGLAWLRDRRVWLLVAGGLAAVALADASGLSKGEVERIWLPFVPWIAVAACAFGLGAVEGHRGRGWVRAMLALQMGSAIAIQVLVRSPW